jgi:hypothetical protein
MGRWGDGGDGGVWGDYKKASHTPNAQYFGFPAGRYANAQYKCPMPNPLSLLLQKNTNAIVDTSRSTGRTVK